VLSSPLAPGCQLVYRSVDGRVTFIEGVVEEVSPPTRFVHTFRFTDLPEEATRVIWELREEAGRTQVTVIHERLAQRTEHMKRATRGWPTILKSLRGVVETGKLPWGPRFLYGIMRLMGPLMSGKKPAAPGSSPSSP
jgi:hypothetical protein